MKVEKSGSVDGARQGDIVTVEYDCSFLASDGSSTPIVGESAEPLTFEVGAGDVMGNALFQAFDEAVLGMALGDEATVSAVSGEYDRDLLFAVPRDHAEVARLEAEAEARGGLKEGAMVTLANGQSAMVRRVDAEGITLDCNHPLAGAPLAIRLKVVSLVRGDGAVTEQ